MGRKLAIEGGPPVRSTLLPYGRQSVDADDIAAVVAVLQSDWLTTGPKVGEFERAVAVHVGARHAIAVSSGTAALHVAMLAAGLVPGDEMITTPLTFVASANCALYVGAIPVFADVRDDTLTIDPARIAERITPRTRAIVPVDFAGQPADLEEIAALASRYRLTVIEDAAHAFGATYRGRRVGALSSMTVFSTHPVKHFTTGEGGIITTDDDLLADRAKRFRNHGIASDARARHESGTWFYEMVDLGYNYRITDAQCALGLSQLKKVNRWLLRRGSIAARYTEMLKDVPGIRLPVLDRDRTSAWHLYVIRVGAGSLRDGLSRDQVLRALRAENIGVNVHYIPVTRHPYYRERGYRALDCPIADAAYGELISLPMFPSMTDQDADDVIAAVAKVMKAYAFN